MHHYTIHRWWIGGPLGLGCQVTKRKACQWIIVVNVFEVPGCLHAKDLFCRFKKKKSKHIVIASTKD